MKIFVKIGSIVPSVILFISLLFAVIALNALNPEAEIPVPLRIPMIVWLVLLLISVLLIWVFIIGDIVHIFGYNRMLKTGQKVGWSLAIWFLSIGAIPLYWYIFLKDQKINRVLTSSEEKTI